jgi:opacity protein-like surface antigen
VDRTRISSAFVVLLLAGTTAEAQLPVFDRLFTAQIGVAAQGDVRDWTATPGASMAVLDASGFGAELDVSHSGDFDSERFSDSSITALMLNFMFAYPQARVRPFFVAGAGVLRVRMTLPGAPSTGGTDLGWSTGGGVLYMVTEAVGFRGDVRYFRHFSRQDELPLEGNGALEFVRSSFGVTYSWPVH